MVNKKAAEVAIGAFIVVFLLVWFILEQFNQIRAFKELIFWVSLGVALLDSLGFYWYFRLYYLEQRRKKRKTRRKRRR
jgi:hypothetical protein